MAFGAGGDWPRIGGESPSALANGAREDRHRVRIVIGPTIIWGSLADCSTIIPINALTIRRSSPRPAGAIHAASRSLAEKGRAALRPSRRAAACLLPPVLAAGASLIMRPLEPRATIAIKVDGRPRMSVVGT